MANGLGGISPEMLQMLAILLQGTAESAGAPRTNTIHNLLQFQGLRQKTRAAEDKAKLLAQFGQLLQGGVGPGQLGPPTPYDPSAAQALGARISPEMGGMAVHPNTIAQQRLSGRMPSQASVDQGYVGEIGAPPGMIGTTSFKPNAPERSWRSPTSTAEHRAIGISESGATGAGRIEASKQADVTLPTIKDLRDNLVAFHSRRAAMASERGGSKLNPLIEAMSLAATDPKGKAALESVLGQSKDPKRELALMLQDFSLSEQAQVVENTLARMEDRQKIILAPEYEPFKADAEEKSRKLRDAFQSAHGRDPSKDELRMLFIADLLDKSGASKWLTQE